MQRVIDAVDEALDKGVTGLAVVAIAEGAVAFSAGFGVSDVEEPSAPSPTTVFAAQSVTKPLVASALMHFVEEGAIALDDPVNNHLREVQLTNRFEGDTPVTIRHLLTHTGGLPEWTGWSSTTSVGDEVANHLAVAAVPGTRMIYSNGGYDVLGCLLATLAGKPWDRAVEELVLGPLGMSSSAIGTPPGSTDVAAGHVRSQLDGSCIRLRPPPWPYLPPPPSGSLLSTAEDLARFLIAHLGGSGGMLSPATLADMHRLHARQGPGGGGMGLGFRVDRRDGRALICHGGDGVGFTNFIGGYPSEGTGVVVLINTAGAQEARSRIASAALEAAPGERARTPASTWLPDGAAGGYRSTYWGIRAELSQDEDEPTLTALSGSVLSGQTASRLVAAEGRWLASGGMFDGWELDIVGDGQDGWRIYGGVYPFELVADATPIVTLPSAVDEDADQRSLPLRSPRRGTPDAVPATGQGGPTAGRNGVRTR